MNVLGGCVEKMKEEKASTFHRLLYYSEAPSATRKRRTLKHHHARKVLGSFLSYNTIIVRKLIYEQKSRQGVQQ